MRAVARLPGFGKTRIRYPNREFRKGQDGSGLPALFLAVGSCGNKNN